MAGGQQPRIDDTERVLEEAERRRAVAECDRAIAETRRVVTELARVHAEDARVAHAEEEDVATKVPVLTERERRDTLLG